MLEYKVSTDIVVPVLLTVTSTGLPHTGVAFGSVTVTVIKASGVITTYTPTFGQWTEQAAGAFVGSGYYNLTIPNTSTDVPGILQYAVKVAGDDLYLGVVALVANLESDTYGRFDEVLGLLHKNAVLMNQTYNAGGRLTSATLRVYDTAAHASLNDGATGLLRTYSVFATYDLADHQTLYRLTSVP